MWMSSLSPVWAQNAQTPASQGGDISQGKSLLDAEKEGYEGRPPSLKPGSILGGSLAVFPGALIHGLGHSVTGDYGTALALFSAELVGIGLMVASQYLKDESTDNSQSSLSQSLSHLGFMLFMTSWAADIVGTIKGTAPFGEPNPEPTDPVLALTYRYTKNPLNAFNHHVILRLDLRHGAFYARPALDVEAEFDRREISLETGYRVLGRSMKREHLALGNTLKRLENRTDGWASQSVMAYVDGQIDFGRVIPTLKRFYLMNRTGYGYAAYQVNRTADRAPAFLSPTEWNDSWLYLESGVLVRAAQNTDLTVTILQDPTHTVAPESHGGFLVSKSGLDVLNIELHHRYDSDAGIDVRFVQGNGFGIWLGLEYAL